MQSDETRLGAEALVRTDASGVASGQSEALGQPKTAHINLRTGGGGGVARLYAGVFERRDAEISRREEKYAGGPRQPHDYRNHGTIDPG